MNRCRQGARAHVQAAQGLGQLEWQLQCPHSRRCQQAAHHLSRTALHCTALRCTQSTTPTQPPCRLVDKVSSKLAFFPPQPPSYQIAQHGDCEREEYVQPLRE